MATLNKILHVEDDPDIQKIAKLTLETLGGFIVESCSSGKEAIKKAPQFQPDLLLLDVMMPGMDGPTTLQALRRLQQTQTTPVIFMTAKVQTGEIEQFKALGAIDVISKPFDPVTLADQVRAIWSNRDGG